MTRFVLSFLHFQDFAGKIITDGCPAHSILSREGQGGKKPHIILASRRAHTRCGFNDCEKDWLEEGGKIIDMTGEMYAVEREMKNPWEQPEPKRTDAFFLRAKLRSEKTRRITEWIKAWARKQLTLPESDFRKAVEPPNVFAVCNKKNC